MPWLSVSNRVPRGDCVSNLLAGREVPSSIDQVWVGDIKYIALRGGVLGYLAVLMDEQVVLVALRDAIRERLAPIGRCTTPTANTPRSGFLPFFVAPGSIGCHTFGKFPSVLIGKSPSCFAATLWLLNLRLNRSVYLSGTNRAFRMMPQLNRLYARPIPVADGRCHTEDRPVRLGRAERGYDQIAQVRLNHHTLPTSHSRNGIRVDCERSPQVRRSDTAKADHVESNELLYVLALTCSHFLIHSL